MSNEHNIAVISTWLRSADGVSIEADKWTRVFEKLGFNVSLIAGRIGSKTSLPNCIIPKMDFMHPKIRLIKKMAFDSRLDDAEKKALTELIKSNVSEIKEPLKNFIKQNEISVLGIENLFSVPYNIPAAIAVYEIAKELNLKCILRHHDFIWEREYFIKHYNIPEIMAKYFPPQDLNAKHIVINQTAKAALLQTKNITATVIPDFFDFESLREKDAYSKTFRKTLKIEKDKFLFLQPTRIVRRKKIERSIQLVKEINKLSGKDNVLVVTGAPLYEAERYLKELLKQCNEQGVRLVAADSYIKLSREMDNGKKIYSMYDAYLNCDAVTFPSELEGFGLPVLEACAYKKPLFVNNYPVLHEIKSKGFDFVTINKKVTKKSVNKMYELLTKKKLMEEATEKNFELLQQHYSLESLAAHITTIMSSFEDQSLKGTVKRALSYFFR